MSARIIEGKAIPARGGEMNAYPTRDRLIKLRAVLEITGISKSSLYRKISAGTFPPPVRQGLRAVAWRESEVLAWIAGLPTRTQKHGAHKGGRSANRSTGGEMNPGTPTTPPTRAPLARRFRSTHNSRGRSDSSKKGAFRAVSPGITPTPLTEGLKGGRHRRRSVPTWKSPSRTQWNAWGC